MRSGVTGVSVWIALGALLVAVAGAEVVSIEESGIAGSWVNNHEFYYSFDDQGVMKIANLVSAPAYYNSFRFEVMFMGGNEFVRYGKDLADSTSVAYLLIDDVEDSTAVLAYGKPFVRDGAGEGLYGTWKHVGDVTVVQWIIGPETIVYRDAEFDFGAGGLVVTEEHTGTYVRRKRGGNAGRFNIRFDNGMKATVMPIMYDDVLYMFDLNPSWSQFTSAENAPTYADYRSIIQE